MTSYKYHSLMDVRPTSYNWNVKVRVIKSWRGVSNTGEVFKGLNLLLLDDKNIRMHAFVPANVIQKYEDKLLEGNILKIFNFSVKDYRTEEKFRCVNNDRQIIFTTYTQVEKIDGDDVLIAKNLFDFYDLGDLSGIANENVYLTGNIFFYVQFTFMLQQVIQTFNKLIATTAKKNSKDVIGVIEKDMPLSIVNNRFGQQQPQIKFNIVDGRCSINVTFWDSLAEEFDLALNEVIEFPTIIIIASAKVTSWQGTNHISPQNEISNLTATKFYLNHDDHNVAYLRKMLNTPMFSQYDFSNQFPEKNECFSVKEILSLGKDYIQKQVICTVKVRSVIGNNSWFVYHCSSCYKQIEPVNGLFHCYRCNNRNVPHPYKKWMLYIEAEDNSGSIEIVMLDREARTALGISTDDIENKDDEEIAAIMKSIESKQYCVKLEIRLPNVDKDLSIYYATGIFEQLEDENNSKIQDSTQMDNMQESETQGSGPSYHLEDFSQLNFETPELNKKKKEQENSY